MWTSVVGGAVIDHGEVEAPLGLEVIAQSFDVDFLAVICGARMAGERSSIDCRARHSEVYVELVLHGE